MKVGQMFCVAHGQSITLTSNPVVHADDFAESNGGRPAPAFAFTGVFHCLLVQLPVEVKCSPSSLQLDCARGPLAAKVIGMAMQLPQSLVGRYRVP